MPLIAIALVIAAAAMHTAWNLIIKRVAEKQIVTWWAVVAGAVLNLPFLARGGVPAGIWPYAIASAAVEAVYFVLLIQAYRIGDFSEVYPIARGAAPAFLAVWAAIWLGDRPQIAGIAGLALLLGGIATVGASPLIGGLLRKSVGAESKDPFPFRLLLTTLGIALCISIYSVIDAAAVRQANPPAYNVLVMGLTGLFMLPLIVSRHGAHKTLREGRIHLWRIITVGILLLLAYMLVLEAYSMARASYVGALREISVVIAAFSGWRLLDERFGLLRMAGALLIFLGILVIATAK